MAQQSLAAERKRVQEENGFDDVTMNAVQVYAASNGVSMAQAVQGIRSQFSPTKIVGRKSIGARGGTATSGSSRKSSKITPEAIAKMDPDSKEFKEVVAKWEKGEL